MNIASLDHTLIALCRRMSVPFARLGLFMVFFWFGALKVLGQSPASPLVQQLFERTISGISFDSFLILFGNVYKYNYRYIRIVVLALLHCQSISRAYGISL